jgi:hypothetical protein
VSSLPTARADDDAAERRNIGVVEASRWFESGQEPRFAFGFAWRSQVKAI